MSWRLTAAISPRTSVRVATRDAYGNTLNSYPLRRRVDGPMPDAPWALNLADTDLQFWLLGFDLDAHTATADATRDAEVLSQLLDECAIAHVICDSGPSHGRHVWIALTEPAAAEIVGDIAYTAKRLLPSLDLGPLTNPATGCLRPPGSPHRHGGHSAVLSGNLSALEAPTTTSADLETFLVRLTALAPAAPDVAEATGAGPLPLDDEGHLYLRRPRTALPAYAQAALTADAATADASAVMWKVLIGAAASGWHHADVAELAAHASGLEYVRTMRSGASRIARPRRGRASSAELLREQWHKAVMHVAARQVGEDPTFLPRAAALTGHVQQLQQRADAAPGRWGSRGGPADRRVLDVLCMLALQALSASVEADTRRVALLAGIGRETARVALLRLQADGWIQTTQAAEGPHAAHWTIDPRNVLHRDPKIGWSQVGLPRRPTTRLALLQELETRTSLRTHDVFTTEHSLGIHTGNVYSALTPSPTPLASLPPLRGVDVQPALDRLQALGLVAHSPAGWWRLSAERRDSAAVSLGVAGRLEGRAVRYELERELWAWWQGEHEWMSTPGRERPRRRAGVGQLTLSADTGTSRFGGHPRRANGKADYRVARQLLLAAELPQRRIAA